MKKYFTLVLKGIGMGAANVIPGVSGGTIALLTGIYEELIDSIKSLDLKAIRLFFTADFKGFATYINLGFLVAVFAGVGTSIFSLARVLDYLFVNYPVYIWAFFFGLILGSVYFVARTINKWSISGVCIFLAGTLFAIAITVLNPATENSAYWYLFVCGIVAVCSMLLPGLSGSFVLILMGNYQLVMIDAVNSFNMKVLIPLMIGAVFGLIAFSHFLSWIFKKFRDQTLALLTGFILGSLAILWPWKNSFDVDGNVIAINKFGAFIDNQSNIIQDVKVYGFQQTVPESFDFVLLIATGLILLGIISILTIEKFAEGKTK
ncbi:DUF368 domain-containing protein [Verrucomicrobiota bacterium]